MARVKGAMMTRKHRNKVLGLAKGYWGNKSRHYKMANEQLMKSGRYAYVGRKQKKRDFRKLWITRISAGCKMNGMNYSHPYQRRLQDERHELLYLHARPEALRHRHEQEDALRDGHPRPRRFHRPVRHGQGRKVILLTRLSARTQAHPGFAFSLGRKEKIMPGRPRGQGI